MPFTTPQRKILVLTSALVRSHILTNRSGGGSPPFSPSSVANLEHWYRADAGVTKDGSNFVSQWNDQSGNGRHLTAASGVNQPKYTANVFGSLAGITSDAVNDIMTCTVATSLTGDATVFVLCNPNTNSGQHVVVWGDDSTGARRSLFVDGTVDEGFSGFGAASNLLPAGNMSDGTARRLGWLRSGSNMTVYRNGVVPSGGGPTAKTFNAYTSTSFRIMDTSPATNPLHGSIGEILIYSRALTATEISNIDAYLVTRAS